MSDRHMHITSYLYEDDPDRLARFEAEARKHFQQVVPIGLNLDAPGAMRPEEQGRVIAFALYSKDSGYNDLIYTLPEAAEALSGILSRDIEIVSAWEAVSDDTQRVWPVSGGK